MSSKLGYQVASNSYGVLCQTRVVLNHERLFQIRIWCAKSEWAVPALEHRSKKLQSVNFSKVKSVFKIREEVQNQNREFQNSIECFKSKQDIPNQAVPSVKLKVKSV